MTRATVALVLALAAATSAPVADTEPQLGTITGKVTSDSTHQPLVHANVIVVGTNLGAMSAADGSYRIERVPPGVYTIRVMMMGFTRAEKHGVRVRAKEKVKIDFAMKPTTVSTTEEILATEHEPRRPVDQLVGMPCDGPVEAIALSSGIATTGDQMHVRGGRSGEVNILLPEGKKHPGTVVPDFRAMRSIRYPHAPWNTEDYAHISENEFRDVSEHPLSTFSVDVDAASYANVRRFLRGGSLPPPDAVRIEELINYFHYSYPEPRGRDPFSITTEVTTCPWNSDNQLVHVGLQGRKVASEDLPPNNLVFLLDVSGSMRPANKLPLLKRAFRLLVKNLRAEDRVAIVVYAGAAGCVLPSTGGDEKETILCALERLHAGGSTAGAAGIQLAYQIAEENFVRGGNNRVILATDGDFNVGVSSDGAMQRLIEEKRESGMFLTVLGFGEANIKDNKMETLADHGNGNYAYIDDIFEARKVMVQEMGATLLTIAKDVKIQIEFNPVRVAAYRLVGYENRLLNREDFDDDTKDAGEIGAGHSVTALYEIVPRDADDFAAGDDGLKYTNTTVDRDAIESDEILTVKFRYKAPDGDKSRLIVRTLRDEDLEFARASEDLRFAAAVAEFGMLLRGSKFKGRASYDHVLRTALAARGRDAEGYRAEFTRLVELCQTMDSHGAED